MNPIYTIMESPYRWVILAVIAFGAGVVGAIFTLAFAWPHWTGQAWFYLLLAGAVFCGVRAVMDWWQAQDGTDNSPSSLNG